MTEANSPTTNTRAFGFCSSSSRDCLPLERERDERRAEDVQIAPVGQAIFGIFDRMAKLAENRGQIGEDQAPSAAGRG